MNTAATRHDQIADNLVELTKALEKIESNAENVEKNSKGMTSPNGEVIIF